ncbi:LysR substrate-binding domain-containing protein [Shimia sp.]|uniref:LysR substrate-binding domain-containing protein n=1 Tax=Shimia sp. TaxID=1954381 RepID=UPI003298D182
MRFSLNQIQSIVEIARAGFHVSKAAANLNTSQSAISKHLKSLENTLARPVFLRSGKRLAGLTPEGEKILKYAERVLQDLASIEKIGVEANVLERETLALATTPTLAHYLLPTTVKTFTHANPDVHLRIQVEESDKAVAAVQRGECDFAIAPIGKRPMNGLSIDVLLEWSRVLIGTKECPLFAAREISLETIATEPIIAFETPTVSLRETFKLHGLNPNYALTTSNPDVMKAYAAQGLGVAIVATPTFDPVRDAPLVARDASHLFPNVTIASVHKEDGYRTIAQKRFLSNLKSVLPAG